MLSQPHTWTVDSDRVVAALVELIEALDRRVPHVERVDEVQIAREAAALRKVAVARIEALTTAELDVPASEAERLAVVGSTSNEP
jgi:hypothetical protein